MIQKKNIEEYLELYKYRAEIAEAENRAVKSSKAYRVSKLLGTIKKEFSTDPLGLTKKVVKVLLTQPAKIISKSKNRETFQASFSEQSNKYQEWILLNEPNDQDINIQYATEKEFAYRPLISIITPVFNPPVKVLEELIESVLEQTYSNFELCLGDFGTSEEVEALLLKYADHDPRIRTWKFTDNKGIGGNSNIILAKAKGEYIGLLDHDDTLSIDALYENVKALNVRRHDFIYSDKDKIDEKGNRFDPLFKAKFSPEMLLNINYLTHFNLMKTTLVKQVGAWDPETDGAQDWDLFLKVIAEAESVYHIPKILYHWRVIASSTALSIETKPYALAGQRKSIDKFLDKKNIPGHATHHATELFIQWDERAFKSKPIIVIHYSSDSNTTRIIRQTLAYVPEAKYIITGNNAGSTVLSANSRIIDVLPGDEYNLSALVGIAKKIARPTSPVIFLDDTLKLPKEWYSNLVGWLSVVGVEVVGGRIIDKYDIILDAGGVVSSGVYQPLFQGFPRYYQSYIGNAEWVRNLSVLSGLYAVTSYRTLRQYADIAGGSKSNFQQYCGWIISNNKRIVMTPHATATTIHPDMIREKLNMVSVATGKDYIDPYSNPNIDPFDPMRLFDDEALSGVDDFTYENITDYQRDAIILAQAYDISEDEIAKSMVVSNNQRTNKLRSAAFILPSFEGIYAGLMNIFSFAEYLQEKQGLKITFYVLKAANNADQERDLVLSSIPALDQATFIPITEQQSYKIKRHDLGIATLWSTAYVLVKTNEVQRKCYFIQDNEVNFYPKGSISALVETTYKFGFYALANTAGLLDMYQKQYSGQGTVLTSKVDLSNYYPLQTLNVSPKKPYKVFFYARPGMPRNAFELGIAGLKKLKDELKDEVEIITAGAPWDPKVYGVEGYFTNLGKIRYEAVPVLYRTLDAGLMFMFSGHPGVTASELMASGCPVVVNEYDDITWNELYQHEKTCLVTKSTASEIAANIKRCLTEQDLRKTLIDNGIQKAKSFYGNYDQQLPLAYEAMVTHFTHIKK